MNEMNNSSAPLIEVRNLVVEYASRGGAMRAVNDVSFTVLPGECIGFIGPNGAGKSTTMKVLLGFMFPKSGSVKLFNREPGATEARRRLGYLPEVTLYYPFMKAKELLFLYGGLQGMTRTQLKVRIPKLLEEVGLAGRGDTLLKNFSKGMQQRVGIAQAIIADPELLILDELSSGLDPVGRHDLRDVMLELKKAGRTIFFSSHELSEVETLCDRVIMINKGRVVLESPVAELMKPLNLFEIDFEQDGQPQTRSVSGAEKFNATLAEIISSGGRVIGTRTATRSLEDYFIEIIRGHEGSGR
ncbi:ABC transporter ATP-binding protein [Candidatus Sumerlaeota bacterium]|nr:ABC transporter ATP-binding protein [Candidatus Sumerlaeota bacterium]